MRTLSSLEPAGGDMNRWRREQLALSGFSLPLAARVARDPRYDLHRLIELVEQGCAAELAVRILDPFEPKEVA